jgi:phosphate/sulfate permease
LGDPAVGAGSVKLLNALIQVGAVILVLGVFGLAPIIGLLTAPLVYFLTRKLLAASKASMEAMAEAQRR